MFGDYLKLAGMVQEVAEEATDDELNLFLVDGHGAGVDLFESRMKQKFNGTGFDPTIIFLILELLLPMLKKCFSPTPQGVRAAIAADRVGQRMFLAIRIRRAVLREERG